MIFFVKKRLQKRDKGIKRIKKEIKKGIKKNSIAVLLAILLYH